MSIITLGDLRALWKTVADWVKGESSDKPKVELASAADISDKPDRKLGQVTFPEPQEVTVTGTLVSIGGTSYRLLPDGNTIVGTSSQRPPASAAASAIGIGAVYWAVDANTYERSDGTSWGDLL